MALEHQEHRPRTPLSEIYQFVKLESVEDDKERDGSTA
jgi:hypothetical protein